jgi:uncharacterized membrane protein YphA (DoxX/SURF4 family)
MSSATLQPPTQRAGGSHAETASLADPGYQAFTLLRVGFCVLPIVMGIDKFFNSMVSWPQYLADWINDVVPGTAQQLMYAVGVVEILAGLIVALKPRYGAYLVAAWLAGIIINLVTYGEWTDIALRDLGLMLGALTLARLASVYDPPFARKPHAR